VVAINKPWSGPARPHPPGTKRYRVEQPIATGSDYLGSRCFTVTITCVGIGISRHDAIENRLGQMANWAELEVRRAWPCLWGFRPSTRQFWFAQEHDAFAFYMRWAGIPLGE
jgi:hypothetical protein